MRRFLGIFMIVAGIAAFFVLEHFGLLMSLNSPQIRAISGKSVSMKTRNALDTDSEGFLGDIMAALQGETGQSQSDGQRIGTVRGPARVIDGDTLEIGGERIRLYGIDAPEQAQTCTTPSGKLWTCGRVATAQLIAHLQGQTVSCASPRSGGERDRYGRLIASCHVAGDDIGAWMVQSGWAFAYRRYSSDYIAAEKDAHRQGLGIWTGTVQPPWEWRQQKQ